MTPLDTATDRWSLTGQIMGWTVLAETMLAIVAITYPELHRPRVLVIAAGAAFASALLTARAHMPAQAKAGLISLLCAALLAMAAVHDPFGLRAVDQSLEDAMRATDEVSQVPDTPTSGAPAAAQTQVSLKSKGDASAAAFADDVAQSVALKSGSDASGYRIDGLIDISTGAAGDTYRLTWSIGRYAETLWCGRIVAVGQARGAVLDSFSTTLAQALRRARTEGLACP
jgi:hypothetical protein